jgi:hypothetical protein
MLYSKGENAKSVDEDVVVEGFKSEIRMLGPCLQV